MSLTGCFDRNGRLLAWTIRDRSQQPRNDRFSPASRSSPTAFTRSGDPQLSPRRLAKSRAGPAPWPAVVATKEKATKTTIADRHDDHARYSTVRSTSRSGPWPAHVPARTVAFSISESARHPRHWPAGPPHDRNPKISIRRCPTRAVALAHTAAETTVASTPPLIPAKSGRWTLSFASRRRIVRTPHTAVEVASTSLPGRRFVVEVAGSVGLLVAEKQLGVRARLQGRPGRSVRFAL